MAAKKRVVTVTVWETQRRHEDDPSVKPNDWRDPDFALDIDDSNVYTRDQAFGTSGSAIEPDWSLGWHVMKPNGQIVTEGVGKPPEPYYTCWKRGLRLVGVAVARDFQQHG